MTTREDFPAEQVIPIHHTEFPLIMQLAIHMLPECSNNLSFAWAAACSRYVTNVKIPCWMPDGIRVPAGRYVATGSAAVHADQGGFYVVMEPQHR